MHINVNDVYSYLFDSFSEKTLIKDNQCECENCYICIHSYKVNTYLSIFTFINIATVAISMCYEHPYMYLATFVCVEKKRL